MYAKINSIALSGIDTVGVEIEVSAVNRGIPCFNIVGLPHKTVAESRQRIRMCFQQLGLTFPSRKKIIVNLAPADIYKEGSFYDFPIAMGIMCIQYGLTVPEKSVFFGELSLEGSLRYVKGALLLGIYAKKNNFNNVYLPYECAHELKGLNDINIFGIRNIKQMYDHLTGKEKLEKFSSKNITIKKENNENERYFNSILGQESIKRALVISASGGHNLLLIGPPGSGKTILAKAYKTLLPDLSKEESFEIAKIYSSVGKLKYATNNIIQRPFRSPNTTITHKGMFGGGLPITPGEVTLAHKGVLFMDEYCEFSRDVLESLRQPIEDKYISISRKGKTHNFPCDFTLIIATNPCPCGYSGHPTIKCKCSKNQIDRYKNKLSGPLLDRIDIQVRVNPVEISYLSNFDAKNASNISYEKAINMISASIKLQKERYVREDFNLNSEVCYTKYKRYFKLDNEAKNLMISAQTKFGFSARSYFKVMSVARTIADIDNSNDIELNHLSEALTYRIRNS